MLPSSPLYFPVLFNLLPSPISPPSPPAFRGFLSHFPIHLHSIGIRASSRAYCGSKHFEDICSLLFLVIATFFFLVARHLFCRHQIAPLSVRSFSVRSDRHFRSPVHSSVSSSVLSSFHPSLIPFVADIRRSIPSVHHSVRQFVKPSIVPSRFRRPRFPPATAFTTDFPRCINQPAS